VIEFGSPDDRKVLSIMIRSVYSNLQNGGHAQGVFGRAGFLASRSTNLRMAATLRLVARAMAPFL
jgi:hypothetical protein